MNVRLQQEIRHEEEKSCMCWTTIGMSATLVIAIIITLGVVIGVPVHYNRNTHHVHDKHVHKNSTYQITDIDICSTLSISFKPEENHNKDDMVVTIDGYIDDEYIKSIQCTDECIFYLQIDSKVFPDQHSYDYIVNVNHNAYITYELHNPCTDWGLGIEIISGISLIMFAIGATAVIAITVSVIGFCCYLKSFKKVTEDEESNAS